MADAAAGLTTPGRRGSGLLGQRFAEKNGDGALGRAGQHEVVVRDAFEEENGHWHAGGAGGIGDAFGVVGWDDLVGGAVDDEERAIAERGGGDFGVEAVADEGAAEQARVVGGDALPAREGGGGDNGTDLRSFGGEGETDDRAEAVAVDGDAGRIDAGSGEERVESGVCIGDEPAASQRARVGSAVGTVVEEEDGEAFVGEEAAEVEVLGDVAGVAVDVEDRGRGGSVVGAAVGRDEPAVEGEAVGRGEGDVFDARWRGEGRAVGVEEESLHAAGGSDGEDAGSECEEEDGVTDGCAAAAVRGLHLAYSTARVSRRTVTLISPGKVISSLTRLAISWAMR